MMLAIWLLGTVSASLAAFTAGAAFEACRSGGSMDQQARARQAEARETQLQQAMWAARVPSTKALGGGNRGHFAASER